MIDLDDEPPDPAAALQMAHRTYVLLHGRLMEEIGRLAGLADPRKRAAATAAETLTNWEGDLEEGAVQAAKRAAEVARLAKEEARDIQAAIASHQKAVAEVVRLTERIEETQGRHGEGGTDGELDLDAARREILGELARLADGG
ncbi:MAG: hypothetical protein ACQEUZ_02930 [Pseudomonadota bacterium]